MLKFENSSINLKQDFDCRSISQGRNPFYVEPAMVICITDGSKLSSQSGVHEEVISNIVQSFLAYYPQVMC